MRTLRHRPGQRKDGRAAGPADVAIGAAAYEWLDLAVMRPASPSFGIDHVAIEGKPVAVVERTIARTPFCRLVHFARQSVPSGPRLLIVVPLSGYCGTLLRDMVLGLLAQHDVYVADWTDARQVPLRDGRFGVDENIADVTAFMRALGPDIHVVGLCQSAIPVLAGAALLATAGDRAQPRSVILIGGPIDARIRPTPVERELIDRPIEWFEQNVIATVPDRYPGAGRRVYPGFLKLAGVMLYAAHNLGIPLAAAMRPGDGVGGAVPPFLAFETPVMDLAAEFFLENVRDVFHDCAMVHGRLACRGQPVDLTAIRQTALMTIEGEYDDISAAGQTRAAQDLCSQVPAGLRRHHLEPKAGHFDLFHGPHWRAHVLPALSDFIRRVESPAPAVRARRGA